MIRVTIVITEVDGAELDAPVLKVKRKWTGSQAASLAAVWLAEYGVSLLPLKDEVPR